MKVYKKLVRDKIPQIIESKGERPIIHIASIEEFQISLKNKLSEEVNEFKKSGNLEELADILEVVDALSSLQNSSFKNVIKIKRKKAKERGAFVKRIILESVEE